MQITGQEYRRMSKGASPRSPVVGNCVKAFIIGGLVCALGETITQFAQRGGMGIKEARVVCAVSLIFLSVVLTGFGLYDRVAKHAGAGTLVPITGFANAVVSPAIEFKSEGFIMGVGAKMFAIAGPVLVYGITASIVYGMIRYFMLIRI